MNSTHGDAFVVAELLQTLGPSVLDKVGGYWSLELSAFDGRYTLLALNGKELGWLLTSPERRGLTVISASRYTDTKYLLPSAEAERELREKLSRFGVAIPFQIPALPPWKVRRGGGWERGDGDLHLRLLPTGNGLNFDWTRRTQLSRPGPIPWPEWREYAGEEELLLAKADEWLLARGVRLETRQDLETT